MVAKMARSAPRPSFRLPEVSVAVQTSLLSCRKAGKPRIFKPVWESSGESLLSASMMFPGSQADRLFALGQQSHHAGQFAAAEQQYREALMIVPGHINSLYFLGVIGLQTGRNELAAEMIGKAVTLHGQDPDWHHNLGLAFERLGHSADAIACYQRAIAIKPSHLNAHNHLGIVAMQAGEANEAMTHFQSALAIDPNHVPTLMSLGNLHASMGDLAKAAGIFETIIKIRPNPVAFENLALTFLTWGVPERAAMVLQQGIRQGETQKMRELFVLSARHLRVTRSDPGLRDLVLRALSENWGPASELANLTASLVKTLPDVAACVDRGARAWPHSLAAAEFFGLSGLAAAASDPLLAALLETTHVADVELERFLTGMRAALLTLADMAENTPVDPNALRLLGVLARQCFINEYVFAATPEESDKAGKLRDRLAAVLQSGAQPPALWVAAVATYFSLHTVPQAQTLLAFHWSAPIAGLLVQQISEPLEEQSARSAIARLTMIEDGLSEQVREQYEENPYPRWMRMPVAAPSVGLDQHLRALLPAAPAKSLGKGANIDILIAGCGTGLGVFDMAQHFPAARILAIDLSLSSLAYSQRKSRAADLTNVEYAQADILQIATIGRTFDLIDSRGVLHHMNDALAGWRALLSVLRPNGLMSIGLYSERAREHLVPARILIEERGYRSNIEDIRHFRQDIIDSPDRALFADVLESDDFYTTSTCRDLLFHVHEDRFTLPQIDAFLKSNRLRMLGFELPAAAVHLYTSRFEHDRHRNNLRLWSEFEQDHPEVFRGMYQFWVQRDG